MAELIGIVGKPGTGKSTAMRTLDPSTTFIINVASKPLPIKGWKKNYTSFVADKEKGNYVAVANSTKISQILAYISEKRPDVKVVILEDASYIMSFEIFDRSKENSYTKHVEIAQHYSDTLRQAHKLRDDLKLVVITHPDEVKDSFGELVERKMKSYGNMLDKYMSLDGMFTYILFSGVINEGDDDNPKYRYVFETNDPSKISTAKSPEGVFTERYIDNDLKFVIESIDEYNN